ncbi:MAG TPA: c-type cytochrome, partial [Bacteroidales bacterium]|nr:c-type cytochrome [Bacteroidales bacterium]
RLNLYSPDVLHGFFIPAFRIKEDVVPGKNNYTWFKATELGEYDIFCSAYCGMRHAYMYSKVKVVPTAEFDSIMANLEVATSSADGDAIMRNNGCYSCHSKDGTKLVGPSFKGLWGAKKTVITSDGKKQTIVVDEKYIEESILDPNAKVEEGYMPNVMRSYKGVLKDEEIKAIVEYLKKSGDQK